MTEPKRPLRRSRSDRKIAGVMGGLAAFFGIDATLLRIVYVVGSILSVGFPGIAVYLILWLVIPSEAR